MMRRHHRATVCRQHHDHAANNVALVVDLYAAAATLAAPGRLVGFGPALLVVERDLSAVVFVVQPCIFAVEVAPRVLLVLECEKGNTAGAVCAIVVVGMCER